MPKNKLELEKAYLLSALAASEQRKQQQLQQLLLQQQQQQQQQQQRAGECYGPLPIPLCPSPPPALNHDLQLETRANCGLLASATAKQSSCIAPTNLLTMLRSREQPSTCRSDVSTSGFRANCSMRQIPSDLKQVHHFESRVFGAQFNHSGNAMMVSTQDQHIRFYSTQPQNERNCDEAAEEEEAAEEAACGQRRKQRLFDMRPLSKQQSLQSRLSQISLTQCPSESNRLPRPSVSDTLSPPLSRSSSCEEENGEDSRENSGDSNSVTTRPPPCRGWSCYRDVRARNIGWSIVDTDFSHDDRFLIYSTWSPNVQLISADCPETHRFGAEEDEESSLHEALPFKPLTSRFCAFSIQFSHDDRTILAGTSDRCVYLMDLERKEVTCRIPAHAADVNAVTWASSMCPDVFLSASDDSLVKIWDKRCCKATSINGCVNATPVGCFVGHSQGITSLQSKECGRYFLTNSKDQTAKIWDIRRVCCPKDAQPRQQTWDYRWPRPNPTPIAPQILPASQPTRSAECTVKAVARCAASAVRSALGCTTSTSGTVAASSVASRPVVTLSSASSASSSSSSSCGSTSCGTSCPCPSKTVPTPPATISSTTCASQPATPCASSTATSPVPSSASSTVSTPCSKSVCPCPSQDLSLMTFRGHRVLETLIRAYFSPKESTAQRYVMSGSQNGAVYIWDILTGEVVQKLEGHYGTVRDVCWHPREPLLVSASWDCTIAKWEYK